MSQAILFAKCLGFNDARAMATQTANPRTGATELIDCLNLTTTPDGCLEKIAPFVPALTHSAPVTAISAGSRFLFQDGTDTNEWTSGTTVIKRFPILDGPIVHTPIDCRVSGVSAVYKSGNSAPTVQTATVGTNPNPLTSTAYTAMPPFNQAFTYNGTLYSVNHADPRFLQHSEPYHYDLYNIGDNHIGHALPVLQAGAVASNQQGVPGCILTTHKGGVSVYAGTTRDDFVKHFYPCEVIDGTLFSGFIGKVYGFGHIFLCADGVYMVGSDGLLTNLTVNQTDHVDTLNSSYNCATVQDGKYLAFGNNLCLEYDFKTKTLLKRSAFGVASATIWNGINYYATGSIIATLGTEIDIGSSFAASMTLPYSDLGAPGKKSVSDLYFTGDIPGAAVITATDNNGNGWELDVGDIDKGYNYRIKTPRGLLGNHISFKIECSAGAFRIEELRAVFSASPRTQ